MGLPALLGWQTSRKPIAATSRVRHNATGLSQRCLDVLLWQRCCEHNFNFDRFHLVLTLTCIDVIAGWFGLRACKIQALSSQPPTASCMQTLLLHFAWNAICLVTCRCCKGHSRACAGRSGETLRGHVRKCGSAQKKDGCRQRPEHRA